LKVKKTKKANSSCRSATSRLSTRTFFFFELLIWLKKQK